MSGEEYYSLEFSDEFLDCQAEAGDRFSSKNCTPGFGSKSRFQRSPRHSTVTDNIFYRQIGFATLTSLSAHFAMILA